jgi:hypothetical protein
LAGPGREASATAQPSDFVDDGACRRAYCDDPDGIAIELVQKL